MIEIETNRLIIESKCTVLDGVFTYPERKPFTSIWDTPPVDNGESGGFAVYLKSGEYVAHILVLFKRKPYELSVGTEEKYRNNGYMKEAHDAVINWIFKNCSTDCISALVGPISPIASRKILTRFGFKEAKEGRDEWWILERNSFKDSHLNQA